MSTGDLGPEEARKVPGPTVTQRGMAIRGGRVNQAGGHLIVFNMGNALWFAGPAVVAVAVMLVLYVTAGRAARASGSPVSRVATLQARQSPVTVALAYDQYDVANGMPACMDWVFSRPLSTVPAPGDGAINETWAHQFGGVDERFTNFKLAVQGTGSAAVQLLGFRVVDIERGPAISGTTVISSDGCGPSSEAGFGIALARNPPVITPISGLDNGIAKKIPFPFVVSSADIQQFQVEARDSLGPGPSSCDCDIKWRLALDWSYEGKLGTTVIDDNGQPFQTFFPPAADSAPQWFDSFGVWKQM
jgi:hypothetical protein